jgi:hypothetical protein
MCLCEIQDKALGMCTMLLLLLYHRTFVMHVGVNAEAAKIESILIAFHCTRRYWKLQNCVTVPAAHGAYTHKRQTHFSIRYGDIQRCNDIKTICNKYSFTSRSFCAVYIVFTMRLLSPPLSVIAVAAC